MVVQGNSLVAVSPVEYIKPIIYGVQISELNECENYGKWDDNRILDVNGKYSYGGLIYQLETFLFYGKKYKILSENITLNEAEKIIYDKDLQIRIADRMIEGGEGPKHWVSCWRKQNLDNYF